MAEAYGKLATALATAFGGEELRLSEALAEGSLQVSLALLRCAGRWARRGGLDAKAHGFALAALRRFVRREASAARSAGRPRVAPTAPGVLGMESDDEAEAGKGKQRKGISQRISNKKHNSTHDLISNI